MTDVRAVHPGEDVAAHGGGFCPRCGHDNSAVKHPAFNRVLQALRLPQRVPYCDSIEGEYASGFASEMGCGCKHEHHRTFQP